MPRIPMPMLLSKIRVPSLLLYQRVGCAGRHVAVPPSARSGIPPLGLPLQYAKYSISPKVSQSDALHAVTQMRMDR